MPRILVDINKVKDLYSGLGQFAANFAEALIAQRRADQHITFLAPPQYRPPQLDGISRKRPSFMGRYFRGSNPKADLWHSLHQFPSHRPPKGVKWILTVHDLNFLLEKTPTKAARYLQELQRDIDRADVITAISEFTRQHMEERLDLRGRSIQVVHNGVRSPGDGPITVPSTIAGRNYFLSLGVFKEKKNLNVLLPLMTHFPDHILVLAGNNERAYGDRIRQEIADLGLRERVILPGAVDDATKHGLLAHCEALLFPSLAEGFGLPAVEAMMLGKPVFLSHTTSLPEIGGDAAFYFDHFEPAAMAAVIRDGLAQVERDPAAHALAMKQHAMRFTWKACMDQYMAVYDKALR